VELAATKEDRKLEMNALSEQHKVEIASLSEKQMGIANLQENEKSERVARSEQHTVEIAALQEKLKKTTAALAEEHKIESAAIRHQLNTLLIQESEWLKSAKSLAGPELAKIEAEAEQAKDDMIFKLMLKRKELDGAGFSAFDEKLPLPGVLAAQYTACGQATTCSPLNVPYLHGWC
jgi:hypothetical protein